MSHTVIRQEPEPHNVVRETERIYVVERNIGAPGLPGAGEGAVDSVFGRQGVVVAQVNDYALNQINGLKSTGDGSEFLADDGQYAPIPTPPPAPVDSVFGRTGAVVAVADDYALNEITGLVDDGDGTNFLADDGTYKPTSAGPAPIGSTTVVRMGVWAWRTTSQGITVPVGTFSTNNAAPASTTRIDMSVYTTAGEDLRELFLRMESGDQLRIDSRDLRGLYALTEDPIDNTDYFSFQNLTVDESSGAAWSNWVSSTVYHMTP